MPRKSKDTDYSHFIDFEQAITNCYICDSDDVYFSKKVNGFSVYRCKKCKLIWIGDAINEEQLKSFYSSGYYTNFYVERTGYKDYVGHENNYRKNARNNINIVSRVKPIDLLRVLDIGCACGFYIDEIKRLKNCDVYGVEFSKWAIKYATETLNLKNIYFQEKEYQYDFESNYFDVVFVLGTIEHVTKPKEMLAEVYRILKPGGIIMITTVDTKNYLPLYLIKPPEHLFLFNHDNLPILLRNLGFKTLIKEPYFTHYYVFEILQVLSNFPFLKFLAPISRLTYKLFSRLSFKSPSNEMAIVAQKEVE